MCRPNLYPDEDVKMPMPAPEIAIIDYNTLSSLGLQALLEEIIPQAVIRSFRSFAELTDDTPDMYVHYFVSAQIFFEHTAFFLQRATKTIVLTGNDNLPQLSGMKTLNISQDEKGLVRNILQLHRFGHRHGHPEAEEMSRMTGMSCLPARSRCCALWSVALSTRR